MGKSLVANGTLTRGIIVSVPARVALAGNPSDLARSAGIGAVLSLAARRFKATVSLSPSNFFRVVGPEIAAKNCLEAIGNIKREGFTNWDTLARATLPTLAEKLDELGLEEAKRGLEAPFIMTLETDIPRQRGMSNSSGWIIGIWEGCLIMLGLADDPRFGYKELAELALSVEKKLGITAGLQDRLLQCVALDPRTAGAFMDFTRPEVGCVPLVLSEEELPKMALLLSDAPSHSGQVHKWAEELIASRERNILDSMSELASFAIEAHHCVNRRDWDQLGHLMEKTAAKRIEVYGQVRLGRANMQLVQICKEAICPANFTGSGGAMVCLLPDGDKSLERLAKANEEVAGNRFAIYPLN